MRKTDLRQFDYVKVAQLDADMWRSYYNHQFLKLFVQLLRLLKTQLGLSWLVTIRLAYHSAWAAAYYRINKHKGVDNEKVLRSLGKFYAVIAARSRVPFVAADAARLELAWWDIHRNSRINNKALETALAKGAAVIYGVSPATLTEYAHYRAESMILPQHEGDSRAIPTDWARVNKLLLNAWRSLYESVQAE